MAADVEQQGAGVRGRAAPCLPSWETGMEEWGGKENRTGKEQGSSIQRISTSLGMKKENFSQHFLSSPSSRLI